MQNLFFLLSVVGLANIPTLVAQPRVDSCNLHERVIEVVPIIGSGTYDDPRRPMCAPSGKESVEGLISWSWQESDDGKFAIVEFVARTKDVLRPITTNARVVKAFEKGKDRREDIESELRKYRRHFSLGHAVPQRAQ